MSQEVVFFPFNISVAADHRKQSAPRGPSEATGTLVLDAPDRKPLYHIFEAGSDLVSEAVRTAREGQREWAVSSAGERRDVLRQAADTLSARAGSLAPLITRETGKPLAAAEGEVRSAARVLSNYADEIPTADGRVVSGHSRNVWGFDTSEPAGVAALITSWNLPLQIAAHKVGAAIAAGCSFVLKPSPQAAASPHALVSALVESGLPPAAAMVVHGGAETAMLLARCPGVDIISLTGGEGAGRDVMRVASEALRPCVLELGGKSANIVFADADLSEAVPGAAEGITRNQGAVCTAGSRILVERVIYEDFVQELARTLDQVTVGDPYTGVDMGAVRSPELADRLLSAVHEACRLGAKLRTAGPVVKVAGLDGTYVRPVLLTDPPTDADVWRRELFGPIATVVPFEDEEEALHLANSTEYGLAAAVWSSDMARCERMWTGLRAGTVYVNSYHRKDSIPLPSSGRGSSGFGQEGGIRGIEEFLVTKSVHIPR